MTKSLTINDLLANRSKSISEQRRALLLPQELMQFPPDKLILLRGGIPPIVGDKIVYYKSRFFGARAYPAPIVSAIARPKNAPARSGPCRDMTDEEAAGNPPSPLTMDDIYTRDSYSTFVDVQTLEDGGKVIGTIEEGDENG